MLETAEANGVQVVINEGYPDTNKDFMPIITKLQNTDYDILIPIQGTPDGTLFLKKIHELNYRPKVILAGGIFYDTPNFSDLGNEITNGILTQSYTNPSISEDAAPGITKFKEDFEAEYGHKPLAHAPAGLRRHERLFRVPQEGRSKGLGRHRQARRGDEEPGLRGGQAPLVLGHQMG